MYNYENDVSHNRDWQIGLRAVSDMHENKRYHHVHEASPANWRGFKTDSITSAGIREFLLPSTACKGCGHTPAAGQYLLPSGYCLTCEVL